LTVATIVVHVGVLIAVMTVRRGVRVVMMIVVRAVVLIAAMTVVRAGVLIAMTIVHRGVRVVMMIVVRVVALIAVMTVHRVAVLIVTMKAFLGVMMIAPLRNADQLRCTNAQAVVRLAAACRIHRSAHVKIGLMKVPRARYGVLQEYAARSPVDRKKVAEKKFVHLMP
jgi:hypothetical protein